MRCREVFCFQRAWRGEDKIAFGIENQAGKLADRFFIFDEQYGFLAIVLGEGLRQLPLLLNSLTDAWQVHFKCRPLARLAVHPDIAAALFHDSVNCGEAQPRSLSAL